MDREVLNVLGIYVECPSELYGRNCFQNCSINCHMSKTCDRKTGVCDGGCVEGWQPPLCNEGTCVLFKTFTICNSDLHLSIQTMKYLPFVFFICFYTRFRFIIHSFLNVFTPFEIVIDNCESTNRWA